MASEQDDSKRQFSVFGLVLFLAGIYVIVVACVNVVQGESETVPIPALVIGLTGFLAGVCA